ncbi:hypothetical protein FMUND_680 [Fusarium mundagurra]|uniref:Uncharacterized protein n=1 Tax=Fusarium mundagurra TaxID=1567541 RepID=A0A8H5Z7R8_9HYPO|nr:hypothetical protein FMUND_680 [Fusarium mundagurra]
MSDDVITDDFDVEVFLNLLHWSWEDACHGTHEPERSVSPFSQPAPPVSETTVPPSEPTVSRSERDSSEEQSSSLDSQVDSSYEDLGPLDSDEMFGIVRSAAPSPGSGSLPSGQSSPSTINHDDSPRAQLSNLKRSASSDTDATVPKRICRQIRNGLMSVTDAELNSTAEPPKNWKAGCEQLLAPCCHDHDLHNKSVADRLGDKQPDCCCYDDIIKRRENSAAPEANVSWTKYC